MIIDTQEVIQEIENLKMDAKRVCKSWWVLQTIEIVCNAMIQRIEILEEAEMLRIAEGRENAEGKEVREREKI